MAPKKNAREPVAPAIPAAMPLPVNDPVVTAAPVPPPTKPTVAAPRGSSRLDQQVVSIYNYYVNETPQRTKLLDFFLFFLAVVGGLQLLYCILVGNYPFNAFLSGFGACVGQFVLTISLRIQTAEANKSDFPKVSPERAFADFVVCSLVLHFFCVNFIN